MNTEWSDYLANHKELFTVNSVVGMFRKTAEHMPERVSFVSTHEMITFAELEKYSNQVARALVKDGIGLNNIVSIGSGRSVLTIAAIIGAWKAGAAYTYIDSDSPEEHNKSIQEQCGITLNITSDYIKSALEKESADYFEEVGDRDRLAVIIFTSGSTGKPKGVKLTHRSMVSSASNGLVLGITSGDRFACFASFMFVAFANDLCTSLILGSKAYLIPREIRKDIQQLSAYYIDNQISVTYLPPHMAMKYMNQPQASSLRILLVGSEPTRNLKKQNYRIINIYASSEGASIITHYDVKDSRTEYPIGDVVPTYKYYIVKENGEEAAPEEKGELWISGPQLFSGYLNLEELTNKKLIQNPFSNEPGFEKVFKTDDIVSLSPEGLIYHGRTDNMVKIRGFRIEMTNVEYHMLKFPGIKEACCTAFKDAGGTNILFGYYVSDRDIDHEALRQYLSREMPYFMVPSCIIRKDQFERTASGKVARKKLLPPPEINDREKLLKKYR